MSQMFESFMSPPGQVASASPLELEPVAEAAGSGSRLVSSVNPLLAIQVQLQVSVGSVAMTIRELLAAREGEVLVLDRGVQDPVDLLVEGKVVARGELVAVDGTFAVRITELPLPLRVG